MLDASVEVSFRDPSHASPSFPNQPHVASSAMAKLEEYICSLIYYKQPSKLLHAAALSF
jgi:hypothetical protein